MTTPEPTAPVVASLAHEVGHVRITDAADARTGLQDSHRSRHMLGPLRKVGHQISHRLASNGDREPFARFDGAQETQQLG